MTRSALVLTLAFAACCIPLSAGAQVLVVHVNMIAWVEDVHPLGMEAQPQATSITMTGCGAFLFTDGCFAKTFHYAVDHGPGSTSCSGTSYSAGGRRWIAAPNAPLGQSGGWVHGFELQRGACTIALRSGKCSGSYALETQVDCNEVFGNPIRADLEDTKATREAAAAHVAAQVVASSAAQASVQTGSGWQVATSQVGPGVTGATAGSGTLNRVVGHGVYTKRIPLASPIQMSVCLRVVEYTQQGQATSAVYADGGWFSIGDVTIEGEVEIKCSLSLPGGWAGCP